MHNELLDSACYKSICIYCAGQVDCEESVFIHNVFIAALRTREYFTACVVNTIAKFLSKNISLAILYCTLYCTNTRAYNVHLRTRNFHVALTTVIQKLLSMDSPETYGREVSMILYLFFGGS